jgi:hypothetical protein
MPTEEALLAIIFDFMTANATEMEFWRCTSPRLFFSNIGDLDIM